MSSDDREPKDPKLTDDLGVFFASLADAAAEHAATCKAAVCSRCDRFQCGGCQATYTADGGSDERCNACRTSAYRNVWLPRGLSTIPRAFAATTLDEDWLSRLVGAATIARARKSLTAPCVAFTGPAGSGKTSLAVAMFRAALIADAPTAPRSWHFGLFPSSFGAEHLYVSAFALAKARGNAPMGKEAELIDRALSAPLVVIDELGGEDPRYASAVTEVIYERHAASLSTWITTGVGAKEIASRYGGGIARKALETATVFELGRKT